MYSQIRPCSIYVGDSYFEVRKEVVLELLCSANGVTKKDGRSAENTRLIALHFELVFGRIIKSKRGTHKSQTIYKH